MTKEYAKSAIEMLQNKAQKRNNFFNSQALNRGGG